jgi:hypothetical protein
MRILSVLFVTVLGATGCYATASTGYVGPPVGVTATVVGPELVYVSPGVQVIADYNEPVFYADGFYWRESGGIWYRSSYHTHGWAYANAPYSIVSIRDRHSYRHYRPAGYSPRYRDNRAVYRDNRSRPVYRDSRTYNRPVVRDNRTYQQPVVRDNRTYQQPVVRDNRSRPVVRDNRKDDRNEKRRDHR